MGSKLCKFDFGFRKTKLQAKKIYADPNTGQTHLSAQTKRARTSSNKKFNQASNKIFVNKHLLMSNDPGAGERGQGYGIDSKITDSNCSIDIEASDITKGNRSNKSIEFNDRTKRMVMQKNTIYNKINFQYDNQTVEPIKIKSK